MNLEAMNGYVKEAVSVFAIWQSLGYDPNAIGVMSNLNGEAVVCLHVREGEVFTISLGVPRGIGYERWKGQWQEAVRGIMEGVISEEVVKGVMKESAAWKKLDEMIAAMMGKGILNLSQLNRGG